MIKKFFFGRMAFAIAAAALLLLPAPARAQSQAVVVEQIVARVNNSIITLSDYEKSEEALKHDVSQACPNCPQATLDAEFRDREKDLLRDLIDQQLLIERAKDMDINVETDVVKRLDDVRKQNNLASMDDLEKAVEGTGIPWEEYKTQIRNQLLTQAVIRREVGSRLDIGSDEVKQYYDAHKTDFTRPEQVVLSEIFLSTADMTPQEAEAVRHKAEDLHKRLERGEDFTELAKRYSDGTTAKDGGALGTFQRSELDPKLEDAVFKMQKGQITDVTETKTGFEILKVMDHFDAGQQPLDKVEDEITQKIYQGKMEPALRAYLAQLREESYVTVKPGFTDSAAVAGATVIQEVPAAPETPAKNKTKKKLPLPRASS